MGPRPMGTACIETLESWAKLAASAKMLSFEEPGWITSKEARLLFSPMDDQYPSAKWMSLESAILQPLRQKQWGDAYLNLCRLKRGCISFGRKMLDLIPNSSAEKGRSTQGQKTEMMKLVREPVAEYLDFHVARTIENRAFQKRTAEVKTLGGLSHISSQKS